MSVRNILKTAALVLFRVMLIVIALPLNAVLLLVNTNKNKILLIPEFGKFGGTKTYFLQLLEYYSKLHYEVVILLQQDQMDDDIIDAIALYDYCVVPSPNYNKKNVIRNLVRLWRVIYSVRPEVVVSSIGNFGNFLELIYIWKKMIYIMHVYPEAKTCRWKARAVIDVARIFINNKKILVTVSDYAKRKIAECWHGGNKNIQVQVVGNTVRSDKSPNTATAIGKRKSYCVLTVGHVSWTKNSEGWITVAEEVVKKMKDCIVKFIWLGDGPEYTKCKKLVSERKLKNVYFLGFKSNTSDYYRNADVYFQPSNMESQGIAVLEAMMYGIPCVVSNIGGLPESVIDGENGYVVDVADSRKMADRIISLLKNDEKRRRYGKNGQEKFIALHAYDRWCEKMNELHDRLIG
ncbi:MAG TPA: glycosyltransferase family 4 protein [Spirochaetota bacterium]|mgnify:FL=1|nr:glycosyltransferase family 4 protein [Spirochaetota bacterium]